MIKQKIAIILPAFNEEITIKKTILDFYKFHPEASIFVVDNNSTDKTSQIAKETIDSLKIKGTVLFEKQQGKSQAIKNAFRNINADIYVMADADCTYSAKDLNKLLQPILNNEADVVNGDRLSNNQYKKTKTRKFHYIGNKTINLLINFLFRTQLNDIESGYKIMTKQFVKTYPIITSGFLLEPDLIMHALDKNFRIKEIPIDYKDRPKNSKSKLNTFKDGFKIIYTIFQLVRFYKPTFFFSWLSTTLTILGILVGSRPIYEYYLFKHVISIPSAVLASSLIILAITSLYIGIILSAIARNHKFYYELELLKYNESRNSKNDK